MNATYRVPGERIRVIHCLERLDREKVDIPLIGILHKVVDLKPGLDASFCRASDHYCR